MISKCSCGFALAEGASPEFAFCVTCIGKYFDKGICAHLRQARLSVRNRKGSLHRHVLLTWTPPAGLRSVLLYCQDLELIPSLQGSTSRMFLPGEGPASSFIKSVVNKATTKTPHPQRHMFLSDGLGVFPFGHVSPPVFIFFMELSSPRVLPSCFLTQSVQ